MSFRSLCRLCASARKTFRFLPVISPRNMPHSIELRCPNLLPDFLERLQSHTWPGNIRELANFMRRVVTLAGTSTLDSNCFEREFHGHDGLKGADPACIQEGIAGGHADMAGGEDSSRKNPRSHRRQSHTCRGNAGNQPAHHEEQDPRIRFAAKEVRITCRPLRHLCSCSRDI